MEALIKLDLKEKKLLCSVLKQAKIYAKGDLWKKIEQASQIYCKVKERLKQVTVSGSNIDNLKNLLRDIQAMGNPLFEDDARKLLKIVNAKL